MINDFATLSAAVANWLARADLAQTIPDLIQLAEIRIGRALVKMRHRRTMATATGTLTAGAAALPADYTSMRSVSVPYGSGVRVIPPLTSPDQVQAVQTGQPTGYWIDGATLRVVGGSGTDAYTLSYYAKVPPLSAGPNWLIAEAPDLYLYAALLESAPVLQDDQRIQTWSAGYTAALEAFANEDARAQRGAGLRMRPDFRAA